MQSFEKSLYAPTVLSDPFRQYGNLSEFVGGVQSKIRTLILCGYKIFRMIDAQGHPGYSLTFVIIQRFYHSRSRTYSLTKSRTTLAILLLWFMVPSKFRDHPEWPSFLIFVKAWIPYFSFSIWFLPGVIPKGHIRCSWRCRRGHLSHAVAATR